MIFVAQQPAPAADAPRAERRRHKRRIGPQPGPQTAALSTPADISIYGGAAGAGKTWALLLEPLRHVKTDGFGAVIFRRTSPQITNEGGLWDESGKLYPLLGGVPKQTDHSWQFPWGSSVRFAHLQHEKNVHDWQGAQLEFVGWDELTHFTKRQFFYLLSRLRSTTGVRPYVRCTCNPDPDSWVADFIAWWIDQREWLDDDETERNPRWGLPILERAGRLRWFVRVADEMHWSDTKEELLERFPEYGENDIEPKSVTFIPGRLDDNPALLQADPGYRAYLMSLPWVERERLLGGNWKVRATAGTVFPRTLWKYVEEREVPWDEVGWVRYWDKAATEEDPEKRNDPDYTAGALVGVHFPTKRVYVADVVRDRWSTADREANILATAQMDGRDVEVWVEEEPGSSGKDSTHATVTNLQGFSVRADRVTGSKAVRAEPLAAQQQVRNVHLVRGPWNQGFVSRAEAFPTPGVHDDDIDAAAGGYSKAVDRKPPAKASDFKRSRR